MTTAVIFLRALQLFYKDILNETDNLDADERYSDITSQFIGRYNSKGNKLHLILNGLDADYFRANIQLGIPKRTKEKKKSHSSLEINIDTSEVHIEHIMPVNASQWDVDSETHEMYLWRLGNLMLLSGPINSYISNKPFALKKTGYLESKIEPNKTVAYNDVWGIEEIQARQIALCDYALRIWSK